MDEQNLTQAEIEAWHRFQKNMQEAGLVMIPSATIQEIADDARRAERKRLLDILAWSIAAYKGNIERVCMHMLGLSYNLVCEMKKSAE
jgi:hypothetical protein